MEDSLCLIAARNLGDIVIQSDVLRKIAARGYAKRYIVWTRPQMVFLFKEEPAWKIVTSQFPVGTNKQMSFRALGQFWRAAQAIRLLRPSVTLDLIGDFRERLFARLAGSRRHLHIGWAQGHPFARLQRNPAGTGAPLVVIPPEVPNVYAAYDFFVGALTGSRIDNLPASPSDRLPRRVGLHPFASQECREWPMENWRQLARELQRRGARLAAFGAPSERPQLEAIFGGAGQDITLVTGSLAEFETEVAKLDLLVGLDSFSVHMAHHAGIPSVMINGANDPRIWAPPSSRVIAQSGGCPNYPCYNKPVCRGTSFEYACIRSVTVQSVLAAIYD